MATITGIVKHISGTVLAVDANGNERVLKLGDEVFLGEIIKTQGESSSVVITLNNGKEVTVLGNDELALNQAFINSGSQDNVVADINALQQAILQGENLEKLQETAAGGSGTINSEGTFSQTSFTRSGSISNVLAGYGDLDSAITNNREFTTSLGANTPSVDAAAPSQPTPPPSQPTPPPSQPTPPPSQPTPPPSQPTPPPAPTPPTPDVPNTPAPTPPPPSQPTPPPAPTPPAPTVEFIEDKDNNGLLGKDELNGANETSVTVKVPSETKVGDILDIKITKPDGSTETINVPVTDTNIDDLKTKGYLIDNVPVEDGKTSKVDATITDHATKQTSTPGSDQVTVDLTPPAGKPEIEFIEDTSDDEILNKDENDADNNPNQTSVKVTVPPETQVDDTINVTITTPGGETQTFTYKIPDEATLQDIKANGYIIKNVNIEDGKTYTAEAVISDPAGNKGEKSNSDNVTVAITPPEGKPTIEFIEDANNNKFLSDSENKENPDQTSVKVKIPDNVKVNDTISITITTPGGADQTFTHKITDDTDLANIKKDGYIVHNVDIEDGKTYTAEAVIIDPNGNKGEKSNTDEITVDLTPTPAPSVIFTNDGDNDGVLDKDELKGAKDTPATVKVPDETKVGDILDIKITKPDGTTETIKVPITDTNINDLKTKGYVIDKVPVEDGKTSKVEATITDEAGNVSPKGSDQVTVDTSAKELKIIFSEDGDNAGNANPGLNNDGILNRFENAKDGKQDSTKVKVIIPDDAKIGDKLNVKVYDKAGSVVKEIKDHPIDKTILDNKFYEFDTPVKNGEIYEAKGTITDTHGNVSNEASDKIEVNLTPPPPPKVVFVEDIADPGTGKDDKKLSYTENASDGDQNKTTVNVKVPQDSEVDTTQHNVVKVGDILDIVVYRWNSVIEKKSILIENEAQLQNLKDNGHDLVIDKLANNTKYEVKATIRNSVGSVSDEASDVTTVLTAPVVTFTEDSDNNQTLSVQENDKDGNLKQTEVRVIIPAGAVAGDKMVVSYTNVDDPDGPKILRTIELKDKDITAGNIFIKDVPILPGIKSEVSAVLKDGITDTQKSGNSNIDRITPELRDLDVKFDEIKTLDVLTRQEAISDKELDKTDATVTIPNNVRTGDKLILTVKEPDKSVRDIEYTITVDENTGKISSITGGGAGEALVPDPKDPFVFKLENLAMKPREADNLDPKNPSVNDTKISAKIDYQNSSIPEQKTDTKTIGLEPLKTPEVIFDEAKGANVTSRTNAVSDKELFDTPVTIKIPKNAVTGDKLTVTIKEPQESGADKETVKIYTINKDESNGKVTITEDTNGGANVEMTNNNSFQIKGLDTLPGKKTIVTAEIKDAFGPVTATSENTLAELNEMAVYFDEDVNKNTIMSRAEATEDRDLIKTTVNVKIPSNVVTGDTVTVTIKDVFEKVYSIERDELGNITVKDSGGQAVEISNGIIKVDGVPMSTSKDTVVEAITKDSRGIGKAEAKNNSILEKLYDDMAIKFDEDGSKNGILSPNENSSDPDKTTISVRIPSNAVDGDKLDLTISQDGAAGAPKSYTIKKDVDGNITLEGSDGPINVSNNIAKIEIPIAEGKVDVKAQVTNVGDNTNIVSASGTLEVTGTGPGVRKMRIIFDEDSDSRDGKLTREEAMDDKDLYTTTARVTIPGDAETGDILKVTINHGDGKNEVRSYTITNDNGNITVKDETGQPVDVDSDGNIKINNIKMADGEASTLKAEVAGKGSDEGSVTLTPITKELTVSFDEDNASRNGILSRDESMSDDKALHTTVARVTIPKDVVDGDKVVVTITEPQADGSLATRTQEFTIGEVVVQDNTIKIPGVVVQEGQTTSVEAKIQDKAGNVIIDPKKAEIGLETIKGKELEVVFDEDASNDKIMSRDEAMKDGTFNSTTVSINLPSNVVTGDKLKFTISEPGKAEVVKELTINKDDSGKITLSGDLSGLNVRYEGTSIKLDNINMTEKKETSVKAELTNKFGQDGSSSEDSAKLLDMQDIKFMEYTEGSVNKDGVIEISRNQNKSDKDISSTKIYMRLPDDVVVGDKLKVTYTDPDDSSKTISEEIDIDETKIAHGKVGATILTKPGTEISVIGQIIDQNGVANTPVSFKMKITDDKASDTIEYDANKGGIYGGLGKDTLVFNSDIDLSKVANLDKKVDSFEAIKLGNDGASGAVKLTITAKDVFDVTDDSNTVLKILGDANDKVAGKGEWRESADQSKAEAGFKVYESVNQVDGKTIQIQIDSDIKTDF